VPYTVNPAPTSAHPAGSPIPADAVLVNAALLTAFGQWQA
jgi:hypothetical protein